VKKFLLDTNVFIQAHRKYYPFDVVPHFWIKLVELFDKGQIFSIDKVKNEICSRTNPDSLSSWCLNNLSKDFFLDSSSCIDMYAGIMRWLDLNQHYNDTAKQMFAKTDEADPWLVAYAINFDFILVTEETSEPKRKGKVKIPDVCIHFGVRCITMIEMFRELKETF
jgi:hypothetical protein